MFFKTYPTRQPHLTDNAKTVPQAERVCEGTPVCLSGKQLTTLELCKLSRVKGKTARLGQCKLCRVKWETEPEKHIELVIRGEQTP